MSDDAKKCGKMTVFRSDRHEDWASMIFVGMVTAAVLLYMAYIVPTLNLTAPSDGKILAVTVQPDTVIKKEDPLYTLEVKEKKYVAGKLEEKVVVKEIKSKAGGKVLAVPAQVGMEVKKGKGTLVVLEHEKGTLP